MMRLALVNPKDYGDTPVEVAPPFKLGYLAGYSLNYAESRGIQLNVRIVDEVVGQNVEKAIAEYKPDIIGITVVTPLAKRAYDIADHCMKTTGATVVLGGPHITAVDQSEALRHCHIAVKGEGELALAEIVQMHSDGAVKRNVVLEKPYIKDIDDVPMPTFNLMDMNFYTDSSRNVLYTFKFSDRKNIGASLLTSRGCPFKCIFCHNSKRTKPVRFHSPKRVISEIKYLIDNHGVNAIFFFDDEFLTNKKRVHEICGLIRENNLDFHWACQARADTIDADLLKLIKDHGCTLVGFGFESGCQRVLDILKKNSVTVEENSKAIRMCKAAGLKVYGNFMFGTPSETKAEMEETLKFIEVHGIDFVSPAKTTPLPGTTLWDDCVAKGVIPADVDYSKLNLGKYSINLCDTMPKEEFEKFFSEIVYRTVLSGRVSSVKEMFTMAVKRPQEVVRLLKNPKEMKTVFKAVYKMMRGGVV